jgi:hypothetical protein
MARSIVERLGMKGWGWSYYLGCSSKSSESSPPESKQLVKVLEIGVQVFVAAARQVHHHYFVGAGAQLA